MTRKPLPVEFLAQPRPVSTVSSPIIWVTKWTCTTWPSLQATDRALAGRGAGEAVWGEGWTLYPHPLTCPLPTGRPPTPWCPGPPHPSRTLARRPTRGSTRRSPTWLASIKVLQFQVCLRWNISISGSIAFYICRLSPHYQPWEQLSRADQPEADAGHAQAQHSGHERPEHGHPASQKPGQEILLLPTNTIFNELTPFL